MSRPAAGSPAADPKKLIWTIGRKLQLSEEEIRSILHRETGKESMRTCTDQELQRVVVALRQLQGEGNRTGDRATKRQVWMIRQLEKSLGWQAEPYRLAAYLRKYYRVDQAEWLTRAQAWRAIESLKKVLART